MTPVRPAILTTAVWGVCIAAVAITFWPDAPGPVVANEHFPGDLAEALSGYSTETEEIYLDPYDVFCFMPQFLNSKKVLADYGIEDIADVRVDRNHYLLVLTKGQTVVTYRKFRLRGGIKELPETYYFCHEAAETKVILTPAELPKGEEPYRKIAIVPREGSLP